MATLIGKSLSARFAELQAERDASWAPEQLAANAQQRGNLVRRFDPAAVVQLGGRLPDAVFADVEGGSVPLARLIADGPAVLIFFRYAGCPACNIALKYYNETLYPALRDRGVPLIAFSPQTPELLRPIKDRHSIQFIVASDPDNGLARHIGITFIPDDRPSPPPAGWIGDVTGTGNWELPQPTVLIVGSDYRVQWLKVSPDWLDRVEAEDIVTVLDALSVDRFQAEERRAI